MRSRHSAVQKILKDTRCFLAIGSQEKGNCRRQRNVDHNVSGHGWSRGVHLRSDRRERRPAECIGLSQRTMWATQHPYNRIRVSLAHDLSIATIRLSVSLLFADKAKVIYAPREVYLPYGKPALLDCHFRANPPLTNLRWEKDGFLFDPYNVQGVFYRRNGSLYFSKVDETHSGSYSCTPYNTLGTEGPSPSITVVSIRLAMSLG